MKRINIDIDDIKKLYLSGQTVKQVARVLGTSESTLHTFVRRNGFKFTDLRAVSHPKTIPSRRIPLDVSEIVRRYNNGESKKGIALSLGVGEMTISKRLKEAGIPTAANRSEAMRTRLSRMTLEERLQLTKKAHDAVRGMKRSLEDLEKRARGKEKSGPGSRAEELLSEWLESAGFPGTAQKAISKYNVDIAVSPVAVEIYGGNWHANGRHHARAVERFKYIINSGWNLYIIWVNAKSYPLLPDILSDLIPYLKRSRRDPAFRSQYRVVWGTGQLVSAGRYNGEDLALIPSRKTSLD